MGIGAGLFLIALGAILTFAVEAEVSGIDISVVGVICMAIGAVGIILTMLFWRDNAPYRRGRVVEREVVDRRDIV
jgi:hypothetical protein